MHRSTSCRSSKNNGKSDRGVRVFGADATSGARRLLDMLARVEHELAPGAVVGADTYRAYARGLDAAFAAHQRRIGLDGEHGCTTHLSVADAEGNLVARNNRCHPENRVLKT